MDETKEHHAQSCNLEEEGGGRRRGRKGEGEGKGRGEGKKGYMSHIASRVFVTWYTSTVWSGCWSEYGSVLFIVSMSKYGLYAMEGIAGGIGSCLAARDGGIDKRTHSGCRVEAGTGGPGSGMDR